MRRLEGRWGRVLVLMTGYDDPGTTFGDAIDAVMAEAIRQGIPRVMWLTFRTADVTYVGPTYNSNLHTFRDNNKLLLQKALKYGGRLQIANWARYSARHPRVGHVRRCPPHARPAPTPSPSSSPTTSPRCSPAGRSRRPARTSPRAAPGWCCSHVTGSTTSCCLERHLKSLGFAARRRHAVLAGDDHAAVKFIDYARSWPRDGIATRRVLQAVGAYRRRRPRRGVARRTRCDPDSGAPSELPGPGAARACVPADPVSSVRSRGARCPLPAQLGSRTRLGHPSRSASTARVPDLDAAGRAPGRVLPAPVPGGRGAAVGATTPAWRACGPRIAPASRRRRADEQFLRVIGRGAPKVTVRALLDLAQSRPTVVRHPRRHHPRRSHRLGRRLRRRSLHGLRRRRRWADHTHPRGLRSPRRARPGHRPASCRLVGLQRQLPPSGGAGEVGGDRGPRQRRTAAARHRGGLAGERARPVRHRARFAAHAASSASKRPVRSSSVCCATT